MYEMETGCECNKIEDKDASLATPGDTSQELAEHSPVELA